MSADSMSKSLYTPGGLQSLAAIVKRARGSKSLREFGDLVDVSHATIGRMERLEVTNPEDSTLEKLAPFTPYSLDELKAIGQEREQHSPVRDFRVAEDVWPMVDELPDAEMARLAKMIIDRLAAQPPFLRLVPPTTHSVEAHA